mgnify:CR=1 FL=1
MRKYIKLFEGKKKLLIKYILETDPIELAYFFVRGATDNERLLINEALNSASPEYSEKVKYYTQNSDLFDTNSELRKRFSELELKTK